MALAFQPLRRSVVRLANRLAYGARAQPYEALADFSRRLAETPTPDDAAAGRRRGGRPGGVGPRRHGDPGRARRPSRVRGTGAEATARAPTGTTSPVRNGGARWAASRCRCPRAARCGPSDERLLQALADQAAVAFRNTALEAQLADHVAELDRTTRQLAESRARIIEADDAARRTLEAAISREVLPHLVALPDELRRARAAVAAGRPRTGSTRLVAGTNTALESLRELTRGVFPTQLARAGLEPALRSLLARADSAADAGRRPVRGRAAVLRRVEAAVYFCCVGGGRASAESRRSSWRRRRTTCVLRVHRRPAGEVDLQAVTDRVEAVGGSLSPSRRPALTRSTIPVGRRQPTASSTGRGPGL